MSSLQEASTQLPPRDIAFSVQDFERVRSLIHAHAGIALNPGKQNMVYSRLSRRLRETGHHSFSSYLDRLQREPDPAGAEWQEFVNCLTTNLTSFFREAHHFPLLAARLQAAVAGSAQRIWCCAASTGEEPYSIAITAVEALDGRPGGASRVSIDASDIDTRVLATAQLGAYPLEDVERLGEARLRRFFLRGTGANAGRARVKPELRDLVAFRSFNLLSGSFPKEPYDVIFCRNVMIYFDRPTQRQVLQRLHACLKPDGLLIVGHSENFTEHRDLFQLMGKTAYRRVGV
jgi:chemotaxis protein methyltransferase CheR